MGIFTTGVSQNNVFKYNNAKISDKQIVDAIISNNDTVIGQIYNDYHIRIKKMVYTFRNTALNPDDIFQEGLSRVIFNIREGKFRGDSSFYTYLNSVCYNVCLKELKNRNIPLEHIKESPEENDETQFELLDKILEIRKLLDQKCRGVIDLRFALDNKQASNEQLKCLSFDEIADKLGIAADNARQRFKRCMDKLKQLIAKNNDINELLMS